jgi:hypothetical protein
VIATVAAAATNSGVMYFLRFLDMAALLRVVSLLLSAACLRRKPHEDNVAHDWCELGECR